MLFDLRGRGRRRTVRVIYIGLALLIGLGLVGFGIGGGFGSGGIFDAATENGGASKSSFASEIKQYEKLTAQQPQNIAAWEKLTLAQLHEAGGESLVQNGQLTSKGRELFNTAANSWRKYLALNPPKPSAQLAANMQRIFSEEGLNEPAAEVQVLQIEVAARPESASLFGALAVAAYKAKNDSVGDLAAAKAVALAPPEHRVRLQHELQELKKHPNGSEEAASTTTSSGTLK
ncbi:MAG TPA: hypothetical protein VEJ23_09810 [Solirubrobacteraceae bacterium]|nr:hypothetical protein [Solirubrobacteraceae bacterium]